jgi:hypothetical protein
VGKWCCKKGDAGVSGGAALGADVGACVGAEVGSGVDVFGAELGR